jgi:hypothetical protein
MGEARNAIRPLSDRLLEAAARVDELPHADLARLLMKAAIRLRAVQHTGARLEHVPVYAYHLLRRITRGPVRAASLYGDDDNAAMSFLLSRDLITRSPDGAVLAVTAAGDEIGEIADERGP